MARGSTRGDESAHGAADAVMCGQIEVRDGGGDAAGVTSAENLDRQIVYAELARRTDSTSEQVGRARARQIANGSASGVWLQDESGRLYQK